MNINYKYENFPDRVRFGFTKILRCLLLFSILFFFQCEKNDPSPGTGNGNNSGGEPTPVESYRKGITRISEDSLAFVLFAPGKNSVYLIGDFNDWQPEEKYKMEKDGNYFRLKIGGLEKGKEYICQYLIDNKLRIADHTPIRFLIPIMIKKFRLPYIPISSRIRSEKQRKLQWW